MAAVISEGDEFDNYIRFGKPMPSPQEFKNLEAAKKYMLQGLERAQRVLRRRRDRDGCDEESAALADNAIALMAKMRHHAGDRMLVRGPVVVRALEEVSADLELVSSKAKNLQNEVGKRIFGLHSWSVLLLLTVFAFLVFTPICFDMIDRFHGFETLLISKTIPYFFAVVWGWLEDHKKKKVLKLEETQETAVWIERASFLVPIVVKNFIFCYVPPPTTTTTRDHSAATPASTSSGRSTGK